MAAESDQRIKILLSRCGVIRYFRPTSKSGEITEEICICGPRTGDLKVLKKMLEKEYGTELVEQGKGKRIIGLSFKDSSGGERFWLAWGTKAKIRKNISLEGEEQKNISTAEREVWAQVFGKDGPTKPAKKEAGANAPSQGRHGNRSRT